MLEDIEKAFARSGMAEVCRRTGARWVNMSRAETVRVEAPENAVLKELDVPRILREAVLITVPVMKTHGKTVITGALKNQFGCLSKARHTYHLVLDDVLADLNRVVRPAFAVMDGTIGLEGNGPKSGRPRVADLILASQDPVALDTVQALCMGLDPGAHRPSRALRRARHRRVRPGAHRDPRLRPRERAGRASSRRARTRSPPSRPCSGARPSGAWSSKRRSSTPACSARSSTTGSGPRCGPRGHWAAARAHPVYGPQWRAVGPGATPLSFRDASVEPEIAERR